MIVPMSKVHIVTQSRNRDRLLDALGSLGVIHIEPIDPGKAIADEKTVESIAELNQAIRILQGVKAAGEVIDASPMHIAQEAILLHKAIIEEREQLTALHRQADQLAIWGNVGPSQLQELKALGVDIQFYLMTAEAMQGVSADCVAQLGESNGQQIVGIIDRSGTFKAPEGSKQLDWPHRDPISLKKEAADLDASIKYNNDKLACLALSLEKLIDHLEALTGDAQYCVAQRSGLLDASLFALQGWVPTAQASGLDDQLKNMSLSAAVDVVEPDPEEAPPTQIEYPGWAKPIKALFDMLGTLPGYDEIDLSPFFMIGLPIFAAMLIGDAGYGLILLLGGILFYPKLVKNAGKPSAHLLIIFGLATFAYGVLTANYFGITPVDIQPGIADGEEAMGMAKTMMMAAPLWRLDGEEGRTLIMKLSLLIGCLHLIIAHLRRVVELFPDVRAYAEIAWVVLLADMLAIIWYMMFVGVDKMPSALGIIVLVGLATVSWCSEPNPNPLKRVMAGFAGAILPMLGTFSDIMSYIRLFAVGLASYYIAAAFNGLGADVAKVGTWFAGAPIVIFGHVLNLGLAAIAIFAHGVRLNMLEFSNNVGVKWAGHAYLPFTKNTRTSIGESEL